MAKEFAWPPITGGQFIKELGKRGVIDDKIVQRVVVDACWDEVLRIYIEQVGDERILDVSLEGAEIKVVGG